MPWFRRRKKSDLESAPAVAAAQPLAQPAPVIADPPADRSAGGASEADPTDPTEVKRRRGSRGGRNRKKPVAAGDAAVEAAAKPEK